MSMSDPLGDMLARIKNGQQARKAKITSPHSKLRANVCEALKREGFIREYAVEELEGNKKQLTIELKYEEGRGAIREMSRISTPGRRVYKKVGDMPRVYNGLGVLIVSTPHGVLADHEARRENVGGEVLCKVF